ncbi:MAG TPA: hypothetical protein VKY32_06995 [Flavobacterium sp.]|nr:hypothetical protein [Flavobacterium sp.]
MKKLRYIPGIISIILLPILGIWYMNKHNYFQQLSAHSFTAIDFAEIERINEEYEYVTISNEFEKRIYKEVTLNHDKNAEITFKYIDEFVDNVIQTKDTINGLKIHFNKNATYNEFIEVLNIFSERGAQVYTLDNNTMYFVGRDWSPPSSDDLDIEGIFVMTCGVPPTEKAEPKSTFPQIWENLKTQFSQNKIIYSAYIVFALIVLINFIQTKKKALVQLISKCFC